MGWFRRVLGLEERTVTLSDWLRHSGLSELVNPPQTAGVSVTPRSALNFSAFFNGVHIISSQIGAVPRVVYRRLADGGRERATMHPAYKILHDQPNPRMTPIVFWQTMMGHVLTWGNAYAEIEYDNALRPIAIWPLSPERIDPYLKEATDPQGRTVSVLRYKQLQGGEDILPEDMLHIPGIGFDGVKGYSVVSMARQSLALGIAAEAFGASFFGNNARPSVVLEHPKSLSEPAQKRLKSSWREQHGGPYRAQGVAIAEEGMQVKVLSVNPDDAQFLQSREFQVVEIARWLNLPAHKLKHKEGERPGGNLEAAQIEFLTDTLLPWFVAIEQESRRKLISKQEQRTYYVEHLPEAILRVDHETRQKGYGSARQWGYMSVNEIRERENLPKLGDPGDRYLEPVNMVAVGEPKPSVAPPSADGSAARPRVDPPVIGLSEERRLAAERRLAIEQLGRFARREAQAARKAAKKGAEHFNSWVESFYLEEERILRESFIEPLLMLRLPEAEARALGELLAGEYVKRSAEQLLGLRAGKLEADAHRLLERWELLKPAEFVDQLYAAISAASEGRLRSAYPA